MKDIVATFGGKRKDAGSQVGWWQGKWEAKASMTAKGCIGLLATIGLCFLPEAAFATGTWCAVVNANVPDGYLNLRSGPGTNYPVLTRLRPEDLLELSTAQCGRAIGGGRLETACAPVRSHWAIVEYVTVFERGKERSWTTEGWVSTKYITQIPCRDDG
ncbi:MAG TPA: SH3 domain-containing protein [Bellilinea sp.]|nr:SH3 domain-containing protein [Bellilinea sp.]